MSDQAVLLLIASMPLILWTAFGVVFWIAYSRLSPMPPLPVQLPPWFRG